MLEIKKAIYDNRCSFSRRDKNKKLFRDYIISEKERSNIILSLTEDDFCEIRRNKHTNYSDEKLYIKFNKLDDGFCIIISFHEQEYPMNKYFTY
ncbi:hypothetical protein DWZ53_08750 [Coprobacillus sp. AF33-1AC]|nr:hypothetical protein DWZ53_08750 [Coprobacillus sp. AF33-1AC]